MGNVHVCIKFARAFGACAAVLRGDDRACFVGQRMSEPVIKLENITVSYGAQKALHDVTGQFVAGSLTAVAGPNGAGKSTLLKTLAGIVRPEKGRIIWADGARAKMGYLPQSSAVHRDYPMNVLQAVETGLWREVGDSRALTEERKARARAALAEVGLAGFEDRQVGALSGGQFQRLMFARLIAQNPDTLLLDEPFAAVDAETTIQLMKILLGWHEQGKTIVCVLHDLLLIRKYFPESFLLAGKCLGRGHTHALFEQKLLSFDLDMAELVSPHEDHHHDA